MDDNPLKEWTLLLYSNGNNELAPETWQSILNIKSDDIDTKNINVIIQVSRDVEDSIKILRPNQLFKFDIDEEYWSGTRRYKFTDNNLELLDSLGNINMAHPINIKNFIVWATKNYPAKKYALSIGGHIYQLTGILPDYSQDTPFLAGFPEVALAITSAFKENNINLDILILDTCFANSVEVIYEFGKDTSNLIKYILTYIGKGPIRGLPYNNIIKIMNDNINLNTSESIIEIINSLSNSITLLDLIAIKLDTEIITNIKATFNNLAFMYLEQKDSLEINFEPYELLSTYDKNLPWLKHLLYINLAYRDLIIHHKFSISEDEDTTIPIYILNKFIPNIERQEIYYRLSFCKDNYWFNLLSKINSLNEITFEKKELSFNPIPLSKEILYSFICTVNDNLSEEKKEAMMKNLIEFKKWTFI